MHLSAFGHTTIFLAEESIDKTEEDGEKEGEGGVKSSTTIRADVYQTTFLLFVWFIIFFSRKKRSNNSTTEHNKGTTVQTLLRV